MRSRIPYNVFDNTFAKIFSDTNPMIFGNIFPLDEVEVQLARVRRQSGSIRSSFEANRLDRFGLGVVKLH